MVNTEGRGIRIMAENVELLKIESALMGKMPNGIAFDSRRVKRGDIFFCKGKGFKTEYIHQALKRGCCCIVYERGRGIPLANEGVWVEVENVERVLACYSARFYGEPFKRIKSIAVTGTKGKSTVCAYISSILNAYGRKSVTVKEIMGSESRLTTPEAPLLHRAAAIAADSGYEYLIVEVSSQAVLRERVYGISFDYSCFTNFGKDHIGENEHESLEAYRKCKERVLSAGKTAVVNIGCADGIKIFKGLENEKRCITFSCTGKADHYCKNIEMTDHGCDLTAVKGITGEEKRLVLSSIGRFGAENALCALAVCNDVGVDAEAVFKGIAECSVAGRGEVLESRDGLLTVVVDYAHNEMSVRAVLDGIGAELKGAKIYAVFGLPGDKGKCRRGAIARLCAERTDGVVICEDDSAEEGYESIRNEMMRELETACKGSRLTTSAISYIQSRREAVESVIRAAGEKGEKAVVLVLGKGDEDQNRGCGCDQRTEKDFIICQRALAEYDGNRAVEEAFEKADGKRLVAVVGSDEAVKRSLAASLGALRGSGVKLSAVCKRVDADSITRACFCEGIAVLECASEEYNGKTNAFEGTLELFTYENDVSVALNNVLGKGDFDKVVYLDQGAVKILSGNIHSLRLREGRAREIVENMPCAALEAALSGLRSGASVAAVIDGREALALAYYCAYGSFKGAEVRKDDEKCAAS